MKKSPYLLSPRIAIFFLIMAGVTADARRISDAERDAMFVRIVQPQYPPVARGRNQEGTGLFRLHINERGTVIAVTVLKSTRHQILDTEAVETLKRWVALRGERREVDVPVTFTVAGGYRNAKPPKPPGPMDGTIMGR
jgi:TonB family protein